MSALRRVQLVAPAQAQVARWVPTLSMDEPHAHGTEPMVTDRLFTASWWGRLALQAALDPAYPVADTLHGHAHCRCVVTPTDPS